MTDERWTPPAGTRDLVTRVGEAGAYRLLVELLEGEAAAADLARSPFREALLCIGDGHAAALLEDASGERLRYWPRCWAARALAYLGDPDAGEALVRAFGDPHWRVRMTAAQSLGRLGIGGHERELARLLHDGHERVRAAAATALGRTGDDPAEAPLQRALDDEDEAVRRNADRALAAVEKRLRDDSA